MQRVLENPTWTANLVAMVMSFLTMGVSLGWWGLGEDQLGSIQEFLKQASPFLIMGYFALAAWWSKRQTIAVASVKRYGVQAAMKNANIK